MIHRLQTACLFNLIFLFSIQAQTGALGLGWAKNSVNTVVFRKNSVVSFNGTQYAAYYDSTAHVVLAKRRLDNDSWSISRTDFAGKVEDAHCSISIMVDGDGFLHLAWNHHNNRLHYSRSIAPESLEFEEEINMIGSGEDDVTYPEFYRLPDGDLIFIYRHGVSGMGNLVMNRYNLKSKIWERVHTVLIDGEDARNAYWQAHVDMSGTIHLSWVWRESWDVATNHDICYARSDDKGISWQKSTGQNYRLPITAATAEYAANIKQRRELINQTSMYTDTSGNPYIATYFTPDNSTIPQYHLIYRTQGEWVTRQISCRKQAFSLSGGGTKKIPISRPQILIDHNKPQRIYLIFRDQEYGSTVRVNRSIDLAQNSWEAFELTDFAVDSWEPSYDTELWKQHDQLHIFVQKTGQGDGEGLEALSPQPVYIIEFDDEAQLLDTLYFQTGSSSEQ